MSSSYFPPQNYVSAVSSGALTAGTLVWYNGTNVRPAGEGANQAASEANALLGVVLADCASGDLPDVYDGSTGQAVEVIAGTGGLAFGEEVVAENATSYGFGVTSGPATVAAGDYTLGRCVRAATAGAKALVLVHIVKH